jgi:hypothetical protein
MDDHPETPQGVFQGMRPIIAAAGAATAAILVSACGSSPPPSFTVHGTARNEASIGADPDNANLWTPVSADRCTDGETIDVLATIGGRSVQVASGRTAASGRRAADGTYGDCITAFTIRDVPGGYASYGLRVHGQPHAVNMTREQLDGNVTLTFGG